MFAYPLNSAPPKIHYFRITISWKAVEGMTARMGMQKASGGEQIMIFASTCAEPDERDAMTTCCRAPKRSFPGRAKLTACEPCDIMGVVPAIF